VTIPVNPFQTIFNLSSKRYGSALWDSRSSSQKHCAFGLPPSPVAVRGFQTIFFQDSFESVRHALLMRAPMKLLLIVLGALIGVLGTAIADDFGTWSGISVKTLDTKHVDLITVGQARMYNNSSELLQYNISQQVVVDVNRYLRTGVNYTFLPTRKSDADDFTNQHRIELDITPRWPVTDRLAFDLRNRFEIRWIERRAGTDERMRNRLGVSYDLKNVLPLHSVFASEEIFYRLDRFEVTENRLIPAGVKLKLNQHVGLEFYYMLQSVKTRGSWSNAHVIGSNVAFSF